ncbi:CPBP family intramembrane metalloprotease [Sphingomonas sp. LB-2]|uniref:CPBP family intramembrane glutamic endopeptidase n=1 Tax=Sphingomonas caeni TaxID=2984949 RepID=UPI00223174F9|nr:CPBP family intramembrane glutamic endopeptidase [Sphingomonas caeni]MCW3849099.1 CPBP family intramembrane metalloprotease [Sphingomonas caeni]
MTNRANLTAWGIYAMLWAAATGYLAMKGADWTFPLISLGIFGVVCTGIAWVLTLRTDPPETPVDRPGLELGAVLLYLVLYAFAFLGWGMGALRALAEAGQAQDIIVLAGKLVVHVALPAFLLIALGARVKPLFDSGTERRGFWPVLVVLSLIFLGLLAVVSPSLKQIGDLHPSRATLLWAAPVSYLWITLEAGLCEEFLFRAVLQSRLAAVLKSPMAAVPLASILFALAHVPGLYLRGNAETDGWSPDVVQVMAFTVATLSPLSLFFGTVWARTRSLMLVVLLHGMIDVLPNLPEFLEHWAR